YLPEPDSGHRLHPAPGSALHHPGSAGAAAVDARLCQLFAGRSSWPGPACRPAPVSRHARAGRRDPGRPVMTELAFSALAILLVTVGPVEVAAMFMALTAGASADTRRRLAVGA